MRIKLSSVLLHGGGQKEGQCEAAANQGPPYKLNSWLLANEDQACFCGGCKDGLGKAAANQDPAHKLILYMANKDPVNNLQLFIDWKFWFFCWKSTRICCMWWYYSVDHGASHSRVPGLIFTKLYYRRMSIYLPVGTVRERLTIKGQFHNNSKFF